MGNARVRVKELIQLSFAEVYGNVNGPQNLAHLLGHLFCEGVYFKVSVFAATEASASVDGLQ